MPSRSGGSLGRVVDLRSVHQNRQGLRRPLPPAQLGPSGHTCWF